jgi:ribosomal-protein-alanine N-acetyltransferase
VFSSIASSCPNDELFEQTVCRGEYQNMLSEEPLDQSAVRPADQTDLPALIALEEASFAHDRISRRSWQRLLRRPTALVLVVAEAAGLAGALVLLFRRRSYIARVYSIAAARRRGGIGRALLAAAGNAAARRSCTHLRLETRLDNHAAQALFRRQGFAPIGRTENYYQDGMTALRLERRLSA